MLDFISIDGDLSIIKGYPYAYIKSIRSLIGSDFHLGYEIVLAEEGGYYLPQGQFTEIVEELKFILDKLEVDKMIIVGDLKHKFSMRTRQETREVTSFIKFLSENVQETVIIRGNHDNFVRGIFAKYDNIDFVEPLFEAGNYLFVHGHVLNEQIETHMREMFTIMAHEHPALMLYDDIGGKIKIPAFAYSKTVYDKPILILPAVSPLMSGVEVNIMAKEDYLSPIVKKLVDTDNIIPYGIIRGKETLSFPSVKLWRELA